MITILCTPRSPFARRVRLAFRRLKIEHRDEFVDPFHPSPEFLAANPLGLVPVVLGLAEKPLPDSALILDELDARGKGIWPQDARARTEARRLSILAEGVMAAAVAYYLEGMQPQPDPETRQEHLDNIRRTLGVLASESISPGSQPGWDLAVALEYVSLRCPDLDWKGAHPGLVAHLDRALADADFHATRPPAA